MGGHPSYIVDIPLDHLRSERESSEEEEEEHAKLAYVSWELCIT